jgi:hypothetical protein
MEPRMIDPREILVRVYAETAAARDDLLAASARSPELAGLAKLAELLGHATILADAARRLATTLTEIERLHPALWDLLGAAEARESGVLLKDIGRPAILCRLCGNISFDPAEVSNRWCRACDVFHADYAAARDEMQRRMLF